MAKNDFQYADGILTLCNVPCGTIMRLIRQVTAPCNVPCGFRIVTLNSPNGSTLQYDIWLWDDMPLNSPKRLPYYNSTCGFHCIGDDTAHASCVLPPSEFQK